MAPILEGSGSHGRYPQKGTSFDRVFVVFVARVDRRIFLLFAKNEFVVEVRSLEVTARHLNNAGCGYEYTIVSMTRIARRYTIQCSLPTTHTVHIELDGGQGGREGWRMGGREQGEVREHEGGREGEREGERERAMERWSEGREAGSDDDRQWRKGGSREGGLLKGTSEEGTDRGMDRARARGKEEASGGGTEEGMEQLRKQGREGNFKVGILMRALARCIIGNPGEAR